MDQEHNVANLIMTGSQNYSDRVAIRTPVESITYGQLRQIVGIFAHQLQDRRVNRASCLAIDTDNTLFAAGLTAAAALLGCRWVHATGNVLRNKQMGVTHLLHDGAKALPEAANVLKIDRDWFQPPRNHDPSAPARFEGYASADDPWMIAQSSGTTGTAKLMEVSFAAFNRLIQTQIAHADRLYGGVPPVTCSLMHPLLRSGLSNILTTLALGGTMTAAVSYQDLLRAGVNTVIASPVQIATALKPSEPSAKQKIRFLRLSGAKVPQELLSRLRGFFDDIRLIYGSTEVGLVYSSILTNKKHAGESRGGMFSNVAVQIVGENDQLLESGAEGIIRIRTNQMVSQYLFDRDATAAAFKDGWFYPGDLGRLSGDGELIITGRATEVLNLGGAKVNAVVIDEIIQSIDGVTDAVCFARANELGVNELAALVKVDGAFDQTAVAAAIRSRCEERGGRVQIPGHIYFVDQVPRNVKEKAMRHQASKLSAGMKGF